MSAFKFLRNRKSNLNYSFLVLTSLHLLSGEASACTSTITNTLTNSTSPLADSANGQCLTNSGTITVPVDDMAFSLSYAQTSVLNSGTIILSGARSNAVYSWGGNGSVASIVNSGLITANTGSYDTIAIWLTSGTGVVDSIANSGQIYMNNTGQSIAIFNYVGNTIRTLSNSGTISVAGLYGAIANNSVISALNNSGSIISSGRAHGIRNNATIELLNNTGTIDIRTPGFYGILNDSSGTINTLNNLQGSGNTAGALTYSGVLPSNYNIIINSASVYGQLSATNVTGLTTFGINDGIITVKLYRGVLQGLTTSNIATSRSGNYSGLNWRLALQSGSNNVWDLIFSGGSTADTQSSVQSLASKLRGVFTNQAIVTNFTNMNTYDCNLFDVRSWCVSVGGQKTHVENQSAKPISSVVVAGYKVSPTLRIGGFLNKNLYHRSSASVNSTNATPLMGLFAVWNQNKDHLGFQVKVANAYQDNDVTTTREVVGTSEAGEGSTLLNTKSYVAELSYAVLKNKDKTLLQPYVAVRYTRINQGGYTEKTSDNVTAPLTYSAITERSISALIGVKLNHKLDGRVNLTGSLGVEHDLYLQTDDLTAVGVRGLTSKKFNDNIQRTRPLASVGAYYMPDKNQRITGVLYYQQLPHQGKASTIAYVNYTVGF